MKLALFLALVICHQVSYASSLDVRFQVNKVHALYNFIDTIAGNPHRSKTLKEIFNNSELNTPKLQDLLNEYRSFDNSLSKGLNFDGFD